MANFRSHFNRGSLLLGFAAGLFLLSAWPISLAAQHSDSQQAIQGFAVERFYPSAPGGGWFVMDDVNMSGRFGGAVSFTTGYSRKPLEVTSPDGTRRLALVSNQAFVDVGVAVTYDRYRIYVNLPIPLVVSGQSGTLGSYQLSAPSVNLGTNPDTVSDSRFGFDMRLFGKPGGALRAGVGAQLVIPSGLRSDYVTDGRYRGMFRFIAAGDAGRFSYAGQLGVHVRPVEGSLPPGGPEGNEFLFGVSGGRRLAVGTGWAFVVGPEFFGETAMRSFFNGQTGMEGLLTGRLEETGDGKRLRFKLGIGQGLIQQFGAPKWRILVGVELFGQRP
jgi:hypothetical protein